MRLQKSIKIDDKEYTVNELTVEEIINLFAHTESDDSSNSQPKSEDEKNEKKFSNIFGSLVGDHSYLTKFIKIAMPTTKVGSLLKLAPSELMRIWEVVKETNSHFFSLAQRLELGNTMILALKEILTDFSKYAVDLSKQAMEKEFSSTDIHSS